VYPAPNTSFVFGQPGKRLPFPDHSFDLVMSMNVLEHVAGVAAGSLHGMHACDPDLSCLPSTQRRIAWLTVTAADLAQTWTYTCGSQRG
jgi:2-polyprenyl-3-methyl-5-hydroxy-6-metoxy-1,4-benzoquinol methylase